MSVLTAVGTINEDNNMQTFPEWLERQLKVRGWTQAELIRRSGLSRGGMANILAGNRQPSPDSCIQIAKALSLPPETVLRIAGHIPNEGDPPGKEMRDLIDLMNSLTVEERRELLRYALFKFSDKTGKQTPRPGEER